jgi:5-methyltetrahydrofolate--homocysteine methyltransferase
MNITQLVKAKRLVLSDGAWGTEIAKHGVDPGFCPELLNIDCPDIIRGVARSYVEAGSDVILSNTFGGSPQKLGRYGLENRLEELNEAGIRLSVEAADDKAHVFGSIGPTGEFLAPLGLTTESEMIASFARQVKSFASAGAHAILVETMTDLGELICAVKAVKDNSDLPVICSMTFDKGARGYATMMGVTPSHAGSELEHAGADAVGSNCGAGIENMIEITRLLRPATSLPLWIKPNAGLPELIGDATVYRETPDQMSARIPELVDAGATFIGGCCGTTPDHISAFRKVLDNIR